MDLYQSTIIPRLAKSYKGISKTQKNLGKNKEFTSELYSFSKATRFFRKPLYQPSHNAVPVIPFVNGKFKPNDTKTFFIGMGGMRKAKKDNVLKLNGISGPGQYRIQFFLDLSIFFFCFKISELFSSNNIILVFGTYILSFISLFLLFTSSLNLSYSDSLSVSFVV